MKNITKNTQSLYSNILKYISIVLFVALCGIGCGDGDPVADENTSGNGNGTDGEWKIVKEEIDGDNDGDIDDIYIYSYDGHGDRDKETHYPGPDALDEENPNEIIFYTYDIDGNKLTKKRDWDGDNVIDEVIEYKYNIDDEITEEEYYEGSTTEGDPDEVYPYTYDSSGNYTIEYDYGNNGTIDMIETYNAKGDRIEQKGDPVDDETYLWRAAVNASYTSNGDLSEEEIYIYEYVEGVGEVLVANYPLTNTYSYEFDANLNVKEKKKDDNDDESINEVTYYTWEQI